MRSRGRARLGVGLKKTTATTTTTDLELSCRYWDLESLVGSLLLKNAFTHDRVNIKLDHFS